MEPGAGRAAAVDYGRIAGTRYDALTAVYVEKVFRRAGLTAVRRETFPGGGTIGSP